jgi:hypothetical protein
MGLMHIDFTEPQPISDPVADAEYWARQVCACTLIEEVAGQLGVEAMHVWGAMSTVPENMLSLLDSPQGWTALAGFAAAELGLAAPDFMPRVH